MDALLGGEALRELKLLYSVTGYFFLERFLFLGDLDGLKRVFAEKDWKDATTYVKGKPISVVQWHLIHIRFDS